MMFSRFSRLLSKTAAILLCALPMTTQPVFASEDAEEHDPAEIAIGERLFLETRFAHSHFANPGKADPLLAVTKTTSADLVGPFKGQHMSCRACHMVDEHADTRGAGMRTYADYASRPPIPMRNDGKKTAPRNSQHLVNISLASKESRLFHFDGQFRSMEDLVKATYTGRNFGWLPGEKQEAIKHLANVIRTDDGKGELAQEFGGSYQRILKSTSPDLPVHLRLPEAFRVDVDNASNAEIFDAVARLVTAYVSDLAFSQDENGHYNSSPYDRFLARNSLPRKPGKGETPLTYSRRLAQMINTLKDPQFISEKEDTFKFHEQNFVFGPNELAGLKLFLTESIATKGKQNKSSGNCVACHAAPHFTDSRLHNTGVSQVEYDGIHGTGTFASLNVPVLNERNKHHNTWLPASEKHTKASGIYMDVPAKDKPGHTDLGLWNVFANPDVPLPQERLQKMLCEMNNKQSVTTCSPEAMLPKTIALFKTPGLRDLGHSGPYMHNGQFNTIEDVLAHYVSVSELARTDKLRNGAPEIKSINLNSEDIQNLAAFLKALNEDYD